MPQRTTARYPHYWPEYPPARSVEQRLAAQAGRDIHDPHFVDALAVATAGGWGHISLLSGEFAGDYRTPSDRQTLDQHFSSLKIGPEAYSASAVVHWIARFSGARIDAGDFYAVNGPQNVRALALLACGATFGVAGTIEELNENHFNGGGPEDAMLRLWVPMADRSGVLPAYHLLTAHAQAPVERAADGLTTHVDHGAVILPHLAHIAWPHP